MEIRLRENFFEGYVGDFIMPDPIHLVRNRRCRQCYSLKYDTGHLTLWWLKAYCVEVCEWLNLTRDIYELMYKWIPRMLPAISRILYIRS